MQDCEEIGNSHVEEVLSCDEEHFPMGRTDDDDDDDSLTHRMMAEHQDDNDNDAGGGGDTHDHNFNNLSKNHQNNNVSFYTSRKPKWWKQLSGGKATKAQKRAMKDLENSHQIKRPAWGTFLNWNQIFGNDNNRKEIWLELGFGSGDNLLALAHQNHNETNKAFVGAEIHQVGLGNVCTRMHGGIERGCYWNGYTLYHDNVDPAIYAEPDGSEQTTSNDGNNSTSSPKDEYDSEQLSEGSPYSNVRIFTGDGVKLLPYIPDSSLAAVLVTFPDPFPKPNHVHLRLLQAPIILEIKRILIPHTGRLYLATDHEGHYNWVIQEEIPKANEILLRQTKDEPLSLSFHLLDPCPDRKAWLPAISRYEAKGWKEGRTTHLACWELR